MTRLKNIAALSVAVLLWSPGGALAQSPAPLDLVPMGNDANSIRKAPMWGLHFTQGSAPDARDCFDLNGWFENPACSTQHPGLDTASFPKSLICSIGSTTPIAGHVNWSPATYEGRVYFVEKSFDQDININLIPPGGRGLTATSSGHIHTEFDSRETLNYFATPWWRSLRDAVADSDAAARALVDGRWGIVTGLLGLDCEHDCISELHPVWLIAIHVKDDPLDDVWALFMRNWGNEGYCSRYQHHLVLQPRQLTLRLPWRGGAQSVAPAAGTQFLTNSSQVTMSWAVQPQQWFDLTFTLPDPGAKGRVNGEVHLRWVGASVAPFAETLVADVAEPGAHDGPGRDSAEARLKRLVAEMTPEQAAVYERTLGREPAAEADLLRVPLTRVAPQQDPPGLLQKVGRAQVAPVADPHTTREDQRRLKALLEAYGGQLPGLAIDASALAGDTEGGEPQP